MRKIFIFAAILLFMPSFVKAQTCDIHATTSNFSSQFAAANSGQTLCLAPGSYGTFSGANKAGMVTIESDASAGGTQANVIFSSVNFGGGAQNITMQNMTIGGGSVGTGSAAALHIHFVQIMFTGPLCINTPTNVNQDTLVDQSYFGDVGQSCTEGRLGVTGNNVNHNVVNGIVISNTTFNGPTSGSRGADGIQINGGAYGTHIGPGNTFSNIVETFCGSVHCDAIQFYGAVNTTVDGNFFINDSDGIMTPDCNGTPMTVTNNVFIQNSGSATNELVIGGGHGDIIDHNTFSTINGTSPRFGNPNNCGLNTNETITNNILPNGISLTEGQSASSFTQNYNVCSSTCSGAQSLTGTPTYVGGSSPANYAGFALTTTSLGYKAASNGTSIGINTTAPARPTNLQAVVQ